MIPVVSLHQVNSKLTCELETIKQKLNISESELKELTAEKVMNYKQITDLEAGCSKLIREKEELRKMNEGQREELTEMTEKCSQLRLDSDQTHVLQYLKIKFLLSTMQISRTVFILYPARNIFFPRESVEVLELEKLKLQDRCLRLEGEVLEKEAKLHLQEEEYRKQDAARVQSAEELNAVARHWTEKWQKVALTLQSTQEELEELKKNNSRDDVRLSLSLSLKK